MRADVTEIGSTQGEEASVGIKREFGGDREIAAHVIAEERLVAFGRPFNWPSNALGAPGHQREFRKEPVARTKVAADLLRDDAHGFLGYAKNEREFALLAHDAAGTGIKSVASARRVIDADGGAWLHRHTGDPIDPGIESRNVSGFFERSVDGRGVAGFSVDHDILDVVVEPWRAGRERGICVGHRGQHVVVDDDAFGSVLRRGKRLGDDESDGGADMTNAVGGQYVMRRYRYRRAVAVVEDDIRRRSWSSGMGDG